MEFLKEILQEIKTGFSFPLALLTAVVVFYINPNNIIQHTQNEITAFILILLFFYAIFLIICKLCFEIQELIIIKKLKKDKEDKIDMEIAIKIKNSPLEIRKELLRCHSNNTDKIPRTYGLDYLISGAGLRSFFKPNENYYIINQNVLKAIKKYHHIAFEDLYWDKNCNH